MNNAISQVFNENCRKNNTTYNSKIPTIPAILKTFEPNHSRLEQDVCYTAEL